MRQLQQLNLNLSFCRSLQRSGTLAIFAQIGKNFEKLQRLNLSLIYWDLNDDILSFLAKQIGKLKHIKQLDLNLSNCGYITDKGFSILVTEVGNKLKRLEQLSLDFTWCTNISDKGIFTLVPQLGNQLNQLTLLFRREFFNHLDLKELLLLELKLSEFNYPIIFLISRN